MVLIVRSSIGNITIKISYDEITKFNQVFEIIKSDIPNKWLIITPYCLMAFVTLVTALSGIRYIVTNRYLFLPSSFKKDEPKN